MQRATSSWPSTKAWRSVSVIGSVIAASYDAEVRSSRPLRRGWQGRHGRASTMLFKGPQCRSGSPQARHQRADRDAERIRGLAIGEPLDSHEVKNGPLLVRQGQKRSTDLLQADRALLTGRHRRRHKLAGLSLAPQFSFAPACSVHKSIVEDREKPCAEVGAGAKRAAALAGAHQGIVDEVLGVSCVAGEHPRIPAQRRQLRDYVVLALLRPRPAHTPYTEQTAPLIPQLAIPSPA